MKNARNKIANSLITLFARFLPTRKKPKKLTDAEFKHTTQKLGATQNKKVKNHFRPHWLKLKK